MNQYLAVELSNTQVTYYFEYSASRLTSTYLINKEVTEIIVKHQHYIIHV